MEGMTTIVKSISRLMAGIICLYGLYIVAFGQSGPGGGFAGGVILASSYILLMLAFGRQFVVRNLAPSLAEKLGCFGALGLIGIAISGLCYDRDAFFWNFLHQKYPHLIESGTVSLGEFCIGLIVAALTYLIIIIISSFRPSYVEDN